MQKRTGSFGHPKLDIIVTKSPISAFSSPPRFLSFTASSFLHSSLLQELLVCVSTFNGDALLFCIASFFLLSSSSHSLISYKFYCRNFHSWLARLTCALFWLLGGSIDLDHFIGCLVERRLDKYVERRGTLLSHTLLSL